jgi:hypothetical protein
MVAAKNLERAGRLAAALREMPSMWKAAKVTKADPVQGDRRECQIEFGDYSDDGGSPSAWIAIPPAMGAKLLPIIEKMLREELARLGVKELP